MRLYSFVNSYLSPMQKGIQTAHVVAELARKVAVDRSGYHSFVDWVSHHKTIIVLDGGNNASMKQIESIFRQHADSLNLEWSSFYEDEQSMGGMLTAVGIIVPEYMVRNAQAVRTMGKLDAAIIYSAPGEIFITAIIAKTDLAR